MARHEGQARLARLSDSDFKLEDPGEDIRGRDVYDRDGDQIGSVADLYVDREERKVRSLMIDSGGFLGTSIGQTHHMIPVEAITDVDEDRVTIEQGKDEVAGAPPFDADVVPESDRERDVYDYYGYDYPDRGVRD